MTARSSTDDDLLLEAIVATPDDDAPRLVWADKIGGERGELVVLQCALASSRAPLSVADRRRYILRERELLSAHGAAWATTEGAPDDRGGVFVRGFLGKMQLGARAFAARAGDIANTAPLIHHIDLAISSGVSAFAGPTAREEWEVTVDLLRIGFAAFPKGRVRGLTADPTIWTDGDWASNPTYDSFGDAFVSLLANEAERSPSLHDLRSLVLYGGAPTTESISMLASCFGSSLEVLDAPMALFLSSWIELLDKLPKIRELGHFDGPPLRGDELSTFLEHDRVARLESLTFAPGSDRDFMLLGTASNLSSLERLCLRFDEGVPAISSLRKLCSSPHLAGLKRLMIIGSIDDYTIEALSESTFAKTLRELSISGALRERVASTLLSEFPSLESLAIRSTGPLLRRAADLRAVIPVVDA